MDANPRDATIEQLKAENAELRELVRKLSARIEQLEREAHRQAAPFRRKDKDRRPPDQHRRPAADSSPRHAFGDLYGHLSLLR